MTQPFGNYKGKEIAWIGDMRPSTIVDIANNLGTVLGVDCVVHPFGKKEGISRIGLWSGSGRSGIDEAIARGLDLFITGEFHHQSFHDAKEGGLSVIAAGHYATETLGVKALMPLLEKRFKVETEFLDAPTGL